MVSVSFFETICHHFDVMFRQSSICGAYVGSVDKVVCSTKTVSSVSINTRISQLSCINK